MNLSVQSVHHAFKGTITLWGKLTQEEDLTGKRVLHFITKGANLVDCLGEHLGALRVSGGS